MVSREQKRASLHEKLQILRTLAHSHAVNKMSIISDASTYIKDLKQKIAALNKELGCAKNMNICEEPSPVVRVQVLDKGFLINVFMDKSSPGLLSSILQAFDELGLTVIEARASCSNSFRLEAVGGEHEEADGGIDANAVELAVMQAIKSTPGK
uniref:Plant bHLH transcription factor ACT-like domain-containing protein n=1 Tax=Oryza meridionalis TaxID=40149 RepID=A0A0E0DQ36_9ORYZ